MDTSTDAGIPQIEISKETLPPIPVPLPSVTIPEAAKTTPAKKRGRKKKTEEEKKAAKAKKKEKKDKKDKKQSKKSQKKDKEDEDSDDDENERPKKRAKKGSGGKSKKKSSEKKKPGRKPKSESTKPVKRERANNVSSLVKLPPGSIVTPSTVPEASIAASDSVVHFNTICIASFIKPIEALRKLVNVIDFQFSNEEIVGVSEDASNHARAELVMNAKFFNEYTFKGTKPLELLLPVDFLCENLKDMRQAHEIDHVFIEANEKRLVVHGRNGNFAEMSSGEIEAMPRGEQTTKSSDLRNTAFYPYVILVSAARLHKVLTRMEKTFLCKTVTFWWNSKEKTLSILGENTSARRKGKGKHDFKTDNGLVDVTNRYECGDVKMTFELSYLARASHARTVSDVVRIYLSEGNPIVLQYLIKQSHVKPSEDTHLQFWVFPVKTDSQE